jgi:hypothetical protein
MLGRRSGSLRWMLKFARGGEGVTVRVERAVGLLSAVGMELARRVGGPAGIWRWGAIRR